jgi:dUTP pyrophosphatase
MGAVHSILFGDPEPDELRFALLSDEATAPLVSYGNPPSAGVDLCSAEEVPIKRGERACVNTDVAVILPPGTYGRLASRSSLALAGLDVVGGVVDPGYRGGLKVILANNSEKNLIVEKGVRIGQMICERFASPRTVEISKDELMGTVTDRGLGCLGSSGT